MDIGSKPFWLLRRKETYPLNARHHTKKAIALFLPFLAQMPCVEVANHAVGILHPLRMPRALDGFH
jgi:hypothetical protein